MATVRAGTAPVGIGTSLRKLGGRFTGLISFVCFIGLWQLIVVVTDINPILLPAPGAVVSEFVTVWETGLLWPAVESSVRALALGLVLALAAGIVAGLAIGASRWLDLLTGPYLWGMFATPRIAFAPLIVLWFGLGFQSKVLLVFLSAVLPLTLSCKEGVQTVDETLVRAARSFGARKLQMFRHVVIPYTLPFIANGIRNAIARGFVGLLIIEMTVGSGGIGTQVIRSMRQFNTARMFAFVAVLVVTALTLITLSRKFEAKVSAWREQVYV